MKDISINIITAKKYFDEKNYLECIKTCYKMISIDPHAEWTYHLLGLCYMNLKMYSQAKGCFATINLNELIELCDSQSNIN